ncbi:hypothetical protein SK128_014099 [Halocaridina rubra]|uniref:N-acetyltransferase domain-containing protein n=1 Tax=Halocaridina rubra TaxID=373956 RepID=A0AAN8WP07_HALRR
MEESRRYVLIRRYRSGDEGAIRDIISEATMETVGAFFWNGVCSEVFPQVALLVMAFAFIGLGIPFIFCLIGIPVAIILIYVGVWSAHMFKAMELHQDLNNIKQTYMSDLECGFWVAEAYEHSEASELDATVSKSKKVEYDFFCEKDFDSLGPNVHGLKKNIVGTVAITKSLHGGLKAWLRRMAVKKAYRRRGIASNLVDEVVEFCRDKCYEGIELVTTECHYEAREMYYRKGFEAEHTYYKYYLNVRQPMYMFYMPLKPPKAELAEIAST